MLTLTTQLAQFWPVRRNSPNTVGGTEHVLLTERNQPSGRKRNHGTVTEGTIEQSVNTKHRNSFKEEKFWAINITSQMKVHISPSSLKAAGFCETSVHIYHNPRSRTLIFTGVVTSNITDLTSTQVPCTHAIRIRTRYLIAQWQPVTWRLK